MIALAQGPGPGPVGQVENRDCSAHFVGTVGADGVPMPSYVHEVIVELLRDAECVRVLLALKDVTASGAATVEDATLTVPEIRADVVLVFGESPTRLAVVVEVQRNRDTAKKFAWPFYEAAARARHECAACVLVFATDDLVAAWASAPVQLGPMSTFRAIVIGPRDVPVITEPTYARRYPSLAVLSAFARARAPNAVEVARVAIRALETMQADRAELYFDLIFEVLDEAARKELEKLMNLKDYVPQNVWAKRMRSEGEAAGARGALFDVLAARELRVDDETRARIDGTTDVAQLRTWISRAARADSVAAIFIEA